MEYQLIMSFLEIPEMRGRLEIPSRSEGRTGKSKFRARDATAVEEELSALGNFTSAAVFVHPGTRASRIE